MSRGERESEDFSEEPAVAAKMRHWQQVLTRKFGLDRYPVARKVVIGVIGFTVLLIGICMVVLPGPAVLIIPFALAILATEFAWARRIIRRGSIFVAHVRKRYWKWGKKKSER